MRKGLRREIVSCSLKHFYIRTVRNMPELHGVLDQRKELIRLHTVSWWGNSFEQNGLGNWLPSLDELQVRGIQAEGALS